MYDSQSVEKFLYVEQMSTDTSGNMEYLTETSLKEIFDMVDIWCSGVSNATPVAN